MILIISSFIITLLNTLATHALLTRKKSILYCIVAFILNTLFFYCSVFLAKKYILNPVLLKYVMCFYAFLYIVYIYLVFKETISKKIFTMFSIWIFSMDTLFIAAQISELFFSIVDIKYTQYIIYFNRICIQILLLLVTYFWIRKPYKKILNIVPDKIINLMSLYPIIAFLLLINMYEKAFEGFKDFNSIYNILLIVVFIISGYLLVFLGINSSSKIISLQYDLKISQNKVELQYYAANFDTLTGIANRFNIMKQLDKIIEVSNRSKQKFALMILDLDKFKRINDEYGHLIGDEALKYTAQTVQNILENTDSVGRFGGDEFVIIQQFIKDERDVEILINRIFEELKKPLIIGDNKIIINISIGVSIFPEYASKLELLIHEADSAMYEAKKIEGCTFSFFKDLKKEVLESCRSKS